MGRQKAPPQDSAYADSDDNREAQEAARRQLESDVERRGSLSKDDPDDLLEESDPVPPEGI